MPLLTPSRRVLCSAFLNRTLPHFPTDLNYNITAGFVFIMPLRAGEMIYVGQVVESLNNSPLINKYVKFKSTQSLCGVKFGTAYSQAFFCVLGFPLGLHKEVSQVNWRL